MKFLNFNAFISFLVVMMFATSAHASVDVVLTTETDLDIFTESDKLLVSEIGLQAISEIPSEAPTFKPTPLPVGKPTRAPSIGIYMENPNLKISSMDQQAIVGFLTILLFIFMAFEILSPEILFMIALIIIMLCQILTISETLSGFSNESMITIGTLFLVIGAVEKSHMVDYMARKAFGMTGSITLAKFRMYFTCFLLSIFFNNTPLVAILMPVVKDWGRVRNVSASQLLMPLSYSVLAGSFGSMIGTSTNLTVQGLMQADRNYSFQFFAPLPIGLPCFAIVLCYQIFAGPYLLPNHHSGLLRAVRDKADSLIAEVFVSNESPFIGKSLETMMNALGIAPSRCIKIRRKVGGSSGKITPPTVPGGTDEQPEVVTKKPLKKGASASRFDIDYIKRAVPFWGPSTQPSKETANVNGYSASRTSDAEPEYITEGDIEDGIPRPSVGNRNRTASGNPVEYTDLIAPASTEIVGAEDIVFISSAQDVMEKLMKSIAGESKGLFILDSNVLALPGYGTELIECVVSDTNPFLGQQVADISVAFGEKYKAGIVTARSKDWISTEEAEDTPADAKNFEQVKATTIATATASAGGDSNNTAIDGGGDIELSTIAAANNNADKNDNSSDEGTGDGSNSHEGTSFAHKAANKSISDHVVNIGDVILCVTSTKQVEVLKGCKDFYVISTVGELPRPLDFYRCIPVVVFFTMLILVASEMIDMTPAALTVTCFFFLGGWIDYTDIPRLVDLRLLMLMGCSLSFAKSMTKTGLANTIAQAIASGDQSHFQSLLLIYVVTLLITELISNNAAAALMYPIAVALADELGVSFKTFAMAVLVASTAGFMSPIGYQTHVMVWGPGGYRFKDFLIFGVFPDVTYWIVGCAMTVAMFPFKP